MSDDFWTVIAGNYSGRFTDVGLVPGGMIVRSGYGPLQEGSFFTMVFVPGTPTELAKWVEKRRKNWMDDRKARRGDD